MSKELIGRLRYPTPAIALHAAMAADRIEELEQQLADCQKQNMLLREALEAERKLRIFGQSPECGQTHWESIRDMRRTVYDATERALAATADLAGLVLCDAEPIWVTEDSVAKQLVKGEQRRIFWECNEGVGTKLYQAKEPK